MAQTLYEPVNAKFSNEAHMAARSMIYPKIFQTDALEYEDTLLNMGERGRILDGEMGVDRIVRVTVKKLHAPLVFTVQERFRRPQFAPYKDITITEWNHASNLPSELYKINAGIFLYGYFDEDRTSFLDAIGISVTDLLLSIAKGTLNFDVRRNKKQQDFLTLGFNTLERAGTVIYRYKH